MGIAAGPAMLLGGLIGGVGQVASGIGSYESGQYQAQVAKNNAIIANQNAEYATQAGEVKAQNMGMQTRNRVGAIKAGIAAGGVDVNTGSAAQTVSSAEALGLQDSMTIRNNAAREAYGYKVQASSDEAQSELDSRSGDFSLASSFLGGASSMATGYGRYMQNGAGLSTGFGF